ncbi:hypothetical protein L1887_23556 [Cichorium endivia]|nr:hypothetical protein L1887_23556 [Cichorium endivia]
MGLTISRSDIQPEGIRVLGFRYFESFLQVTVIWDFLKRGRALCHLHAQGVNIHSGEEVGVKLIFGGIVNAGNPDLPSTDLADSDYLLFNFNDYPNGMVTLFNLLVMGSW